MKKLLFIIGLLSTSIGLGQTPGNTGLLVAEYQKSYKGIGNYTHLVRYNFVDGAFFSKDTILSAPTSKEGRRGSYVRYDLGNNFIYQNRYVISGIGNIIDVQTKSLLLGESDNFIETKGDSIIYYLGTPARRVAGSVKALRLME